MASVHPVCVGSSGAKGIFGWLLTSLLRCNAPVLVGSSGAEDIAYALNMLSGTSSLVHPPVIAPKLHLGIVGSSGATWLFPLQYSKLHPRLRVGLSGWHRIDRCLCFGSSGATVNCRTRPFRPFFEFFLHVLLCLAFLLYPWDLLMFT